MASHSRTVLPLTLGLPAGPVFAESPGPAPAGRSTDHSGLAVIVLLVAVGVFATIWIRRAAARYRRSLKHGTEGAGQLVNPLDADPLAVRPAEEPEDPRST
jgi:hypothetical protein